VTLILQVFKANKRNLVYFRDFDLDPAIKGNNVHE
jgi:hypothetical protein